MLTVNSCLCVDLQTGGLIIGWLSFIGNALGCIISVILFILLCVYNCNDLADRMTSKHLELCNIYHGAELTDIFAITAPAICVTSADKKTLGFSVLTNLNFLVAMVVLVILVVLSVAFGYIAWRCIQGANTRDHFKLKPMMISLGVVTALSALEILGFTASAVIYGLIQFLINGYCFTVIYSLYTVYKQEYESNGNKNNYRQGGGGIV